MLINDLEEKQLQKYDFIVIGAGIVGLTIARELRNEYPDKSILILDKEKDAIQHASGRNSGVLHSGFYYSEDSLKAKLTVTGNQRMKAFCFENNIPVNNCQKLVVAKNESELDGLMELEKRAKVNSVEAYIISEKEVAAIDPNAKTCQKALLSPTTASVDPKVVCYKLTDELKKVEVNVVFGEMVVNIIDDKLITKENEYQFNYLVNCAGLYADKISQIMGIGMDYILLPFKGIYLKYKKNKTDIKTNIYPVPDLKNPFLGVHFTKTVDGSIKLGPTAIPAFWRENYSGFEGFSFKEMIEVLWHESKLFFKNSFNFRGLAVSEMRKYIKPLFIKEARKLVKYIENDFETMPSGIRAQLLNIKTDELVMDFLVEHSPNSTHVLNAVSPAFTCSFAFAEYVVKEIKKNRENKTPLKNCQK